MLYSYRDTITIVKLSPSHPSSPVVDTCAGWPFITRHGGNTGRKVSTGGNLKPLIYGQEISRAYSSLAPDRPCAGAKCDASSHPRPGSVEINPVFWRAPALKRRQRNHITVHHTFTPVYISWPSAPRLSCLDVRCLCGHLTKREKLNIYDVGFSFQSSLRYVILSTCRFAFISLQLVRQ